MLALLMALGLALAEPTEVDPLALAATLVRDGHLDRAAIALADVDPDGLPLADRRLAHRLLGRIAAEQGDPARAVHHYEAAVALAPSTARLRGERPEAHQQRLLDEAQQQALTQLHLAQALLQLDPPAPDRALRALEASDLRQRPGWWLLTARAEELAGRPEYAYERLVEGETTFPDEPAFLKGQTFLLIELGLGQEAVERGQRWMERAGPDPEAYLAMAEGLRRGAAGNPFSMQLAHAQELMEAGRLHFPDHPGLATLHARILLERGQAASAALLLEQQAVTDPGRALAAAEAWKRAGRLERALLLNGRVEDSAEKARQRLGLLLELRSWERALALEERLRRLGLLQEDRVAYGIAYAAAMSGLAEVAERNLARIQDTAVFEAANALRLWLLRCAEDGGCP